MASLALAQADYEAAAAELRRWETGQKTAIPIRPEAPRGIDAIVAQELAWRRVQTTDERRPGPLGRLLRRLTRR